MQEETLFLIKPDARDNDVVLADLMMECQKNGLEYLGFQEKKLTDKQVIALWENSCCGDYVLRKMLIKYYFQKKVRIIFVRGINVYEKAHRIKHLIRDRYAVDWYKNCVHSPDNAEEYQRDVSILNNDGIFSVSDDYLNAYDKLTRKYVEYLEANAQSFFEAIDLYLSIDEKWYFEKEREFKEQYRNVLRISNATPNKTVTYFMARIHEALIKSTIQDELLSTEGLFMFGDVSVCGADSSIETEELCQRLSRYFQVSCHKSESTSVTNEK